MDGPSRGLGPRRSAALSWCGSWVACSPGCDACEARNRRLTMDTFFRDGHRALGRASRKTLSAGARDYSATIPRRRLFRHCFAPAWVAYTRMLACAGSCGASMRITTLGGGATQANSWALGSMGGRGRRPLAHLTPYLSSWSQRNRQNEREAALKKVSAALNLERCWPVRSCARRMQIGHAGLPCLRRC